MQIILYENDMLFIAKILAHATRKNIHTIIVREPHRLLEQKDPKIIILNLEVQTKELLDCIQQVKEKFDNLRIIGYCSHTNQNLLKEAKEIGIDAMPRSVFVQKVESYFT